MRINRTSGIPADGWDQLLRHTYFAFYVKWYPHTGCVEALLQPEYGGLESSDIERALTKHQKHMVEALRWGLRDSLCVDLFMFLVHSMTEPNIMG